jgi:hypothetical protein
MRGTIAFAWPTYQQAACSECKYSRHVLVAAAARIIGLAVIQRKVLGFSTKDNCYRTSVILIGRAISG